MEPKTSFAPGRKCSGHARHLLFALLRRVLDLNRARTIAEVVADADRFSSVGGVTIAGDAEGSAALSAEHDHVRPITPIFASRSIWRSRRRLKALGERAREIVLELLGKVSR